MRRHRGDQGFSLIELMTVVLIISVLVAIAYPVFRGSLSQARRRTCHSNERVMEGAYSQYLANVGMEGALAVTDWSSLCAQLVPSYVRRAPHCPEDGVYTWANGNLNCSVHGSFQ